MSARATVRPTQERRILLFWRLSTGFVVLNTSPTRTPIFWGYRPSEVLKPIRGVTQ